MPRWQHKGPEHRNWQPNMDRTPSGQNRDVKRKYQASPRGKYSTQRGCARARNIEWLFTFETWWAAWEPHWAGRGRTRDGLVMSRRGDSGPYSPDNVEIITNRANRLQQAENGTEATRRVGSQAPQAKLTEADITNIRKLLAVGQSHREIGNTYGVCGYSIGEIARGRAWKHV